MAAEMTAAPVLAESNTVRREEERLRAMLAERLDIHVRFTSLPGARALLVSPLTAGRPKGLIVDRSLTAAQRISMYVHFAAHIALRHDLPLVTIVESRVETTSGDANGHRDADQLARAMWWGTTARGELREIWPGRRSPLLRPLLTSRPARLGLRLVLRVLRRAYYGARVSGLLEGTIIVRWLRDALCVTAVVCAAPELVADATRSRATAGIRP